MSYIERHAPCPVESDQNEFLFPDLCSAIASTFISIAVVHTLIDEHLAFCNVATQLLSLAYLFSVAHFTIPHLLAMLWARYTVNPGFHWVWPNFSRM